MQSFLSKVCVGEKCCSSIAYLSPPIFGGYYNISPVPTTISADTSDVDCDSKIHFYKKK
jgi:hypothetical protein